MKLSEIKNIATKIVKEMSGTSGGTAQGSNVTGNGTGEQTFTPVAVKKPKKAKKVKQEVKDVEPKLAAGKVKDNYYVSHFGYTPAPSVPNRKSKAMDYKQLFELEEGSIEESKQEWAIKNIEALVKDYATKNNLDLKLVDKKQQTNSYGSKKTIYIYKLGTKDLVMIDDKAAGAPRLNDFVVVIGDIEPGTSTLKNSMSVSKTAYTGMNDITRMLDKAFGNKDLTEDTVEEAYIPDNIKKFAERKKISNTVNQVAGWAEKAGKRIVGGTAIGKNYDTLILDLTHQGGEIYIMDGRDIEVNGLPVEDYEDFVKALGGESLNENYSQFRNKTSKRDSPEQLHKAVKEIKKKLQEVDKLVEYTNRLRSEISEGEGEVKYNTHTTRALEQIQEMIKHTYIKAKKLK